MLEKVYLNGIAVYPFTSDEEILSMLDNRKGIVVSVNAESILNANSETRELLDKNIGHCDGIGTVKALKQKGCKNVFKIAGCELWLKIIERNVVKKTFYLIGAKPQVIEDTVSKLRTEFPNINILGYRDGYIKTKQERSSLIDDIEQKKPDIVFVAMGAPTQELLMQDMFNKHEAIYQGLGGSFDVYSGHVKRAPLWWQKHNLEFAYRLLSEPKRIKRQLPLIKFVYWLLIRKFK